MRKGKRCHCKHKRRGKGMMRDLIKKGKRMGKKALHDHAKKHGKKYFQKGISYLKRQAAKKNIEL